MGEEGRNGLLSVQKLLIANRGEIAVRIIKSAKKLGVRTVAIYTQVDATSAHVLLADEAFALVSSTSSSTNPEDEPLASNALAYLDAKALLKACRESGATMVHPGYGFLSENAEFASLVEENGIKFLGPTSETIANMGLKHRARAIAKEAGVPIVPGSEWLVDTIEDACRSAREIGYPVMLKASAGGGGMGLIVCKDEAELRMRYTSSLERAKNIFHNPGLFIERYFESSRHIEVQIFGDGMGLLIHFGERECSVQRRHQKIIEEAPSPFLLDRPELRERIWDAAVRLGQSIAYKSAGTVEFIVDERTEEFFFLEMNTRLQVEHGVTEMLYAGLDIVALMIFQGLAETAHSIASVPFLEQLRLSIPDPRGHAIEARLYCENPAENFCPSPGILQNVSFPDQDHLTRVDSWVTSGTSISPFYDPLIAKVIVLDMTRYDAMKRLSMILGEAYDESEHIYGSVQTVNIQGPANNIAFLRQILNEDVFRNGEATTQWIDSGGVTFIPSAFTVISPGISASVQSLPVRNIGIGVPPSGPMDSMAFQAANILVGNAPEVEGIELVVPPPAPGLTKALAFVAHFHSEAIVAISGAAVTVSLDNQQKKAWEAFVVPAGSKLMINGAVEEAAIGGGSRAYLSIAGGLPGIPEYLGSKSTSMGFGGYQGRELQRGDMLDISSTIDIKGWVPPLILNSLIPHYPSRWTLFTLPGPHDDEEFITKKGIEAFYARLWRVGSASNRMGIRLEPVPGIDEEESSVIDWARESGGEGGSHPSNILDNGYARGSVNLNGDTPVILTPEGPDMGGYLCITTIASADQWKLGQIRPGDEVQFSIVSHKDAMQLQDHNQRWLETILATVSGFNAAPLNLLSFQPAGLPSSSSILNRAPATATKPEFLVRQAGDTALLVEFGDMKLDFNNRARVHALELKLRDMCVSGIKRMCPCIRSTLIHYDPFETSQEEVLEIILAAEEMLPEDSSAMQFPGRKLTFPIVLDDKWNREALKRYMQSMRDQAVYLPSNIEYLARNNGLEGGAEEALKILVQSPWLVFGVGFYLSCPFLVPIDPRCRLIGQKMNPSRTFTPRGAMGIAGPVAAIYPVESPGGYQLYGRTLPTWQGWGRGKDFSLSKPWLLEPFDQVVFEVVSEDAYAQLEKDFDNGRYAFKIEDVIFSMKEYNDMVSSLQSEIDLFKEKQRQGSAKEEAREHDLLRAWQERKKASPAMKTASHSKETAHFVSSPLSGTLWKVKCAIGDIVEVPDQVLAILEAMKTEIPVVAGEDLVGMKVSSIALAEGEQVKSGDRLLYFESG